MIGFMLIFFGLFIIIAVLIFLLLDFVINWFGEDLFKRSTDFTIFPFISTFSQKTLWDVMLLP